MTNQQRDTDFAHVRVGTEIGFQDPPFGGGKNVVTEASDGGFWVKTDLYSPRYFLSLYHWEKAGGYIISQPDEAPQAPALDEAAIRDKALEEAARVCDEEGSSLGAAIRQMKGAAGV